MTPVSAEELLAPEDLERVRAAIRAAEARTSGEIRVHLDDTIVDDVLDHAAFVFEELGMHRTKDRNGAMIYVSVSERRAAVIGDVGIHAKLPNGFWNDTLNVILEEFKAGRYCDGLCKGVEQLGGQLRAHFPHERSDLNELSDDISFGR